MENAIKNQNTNPDFDFEIESGYPYLEHHFETVQHLESRIDREGFIGCMKF